MEFTRRIHRGAAVIAVYVYVFAVVPLALWGFELQNAYVQHPKFYSASIKDQERVYQFEAEIEATYCCKEGSLRYANTYALNVTGTWHQAQKEAIEKLDLGKSYTVEITYVCPTDPWLIPDTKCKYNLELGPAHNTTDDVLLKILSSSIPDGPLSKKWFPKSLPAYLRPTPEILKPTEQDIHITDLHAGLGVVIRLPSWFAEFATARNRNVQVVAVGPIAGYYPPGGNISVPMQEAVGCLDMKCVVVHVPDTFFAKSGPGGYIVNVNIGDAKAAYVKFKALPPTPVLAAKPDQSPQAAAPHLPVPASGPSAKPGQSAQAAAPHLPVPASGPPAKPDQSAQAAAPPLLVPAPRPSAKPDRSAPAAAASRIPVQRRVFPGPAWQGARIDWCLHWGQMCGGPAANEFCRKNGYAKATAWAPASDAGPTLVLGDNKPCTAKNCDGFASVTCTN